MSKPANPVTLPLADYSPKHFLLAVVGGVATVTLNRPERKNPLTFESYRELTDLDLIEVSVVTHPMQPAARVLAVDHTT